MSRSLRRQFTFLRAYATVTSTLLVVLAVAAFRQPPGQRPADSGPRNLGEITVERINVVDADGTLRMVIANKNRMHPGVMDGKVIDRPRPVAGMIFFNDQGDEVGGLTYTGQLQNGVRRADAGLMFDQLKQDQTIGLSYSESNDRRTAGFQIWDRSEQPLSELIEQLNAANRIQDRAEREAAVSAIRAKAPPGPRRVFVGKTSDKSSTVVLSDAQGKPRLTLTVDSGGNPRIEFLDENGRVTAKLPQEK